MIDYLIDQYRKWRWWWRLAGYECERAEQCRYYWTKPKCVTWEKWHETVEGFIGEAIIPDVDDDYFD